MAAPAISRSLFRASAIVASLAGSLGATLPASRAFAQTQAPSVPSAPSGLEATSHGGRPFPAGLTRSHTQTLDGLAVTRDESLRSVALPQERKRAPWWAPVASVLIPGSGQAALGQQRAAAYLVADVYLVAQALSAQRAGNSDRAQYRRIAANVARAQFTAAPPLGGWGYYEILESAIESGVFSKSVGRVDPETDVETFNGATWRQAREIHWSDPDVAPPTTSPEYARAIAFYEARAVRDDFRWSWRNGGLQWDEYRQAVKESNRNYKRAVTVAGLVGANHLASLIDAYITVRIRRFGGAGVEVAGLRVEGIETSVVPVDLGASPAPQLRSALRLSFGDGR